MRRTGEGMTLEIEMLAAKTAGSLPPCGGEVERGVSPGFGMRGLPPSLTLPHKGGGNAASFAAARVATGGSLA